ncbi:calcium/sodium antiporter [Candidatus Nomurabacteria bacterium]|nr:calcium/sodium antiporter [Candidatus Nomurabacteria bacterium]
MSIVLFFVGFFLLIKGADWLVSGSSSLASKIGVSALIIGLTVVAFGTSAPELTVNLLASFNGNTDLAIANVVGSNIANILLILGISATIFPLAVQKGTVWREIPFAILAVIVVSVMASDVIIDNASTSVLSRTEGIVLMSFFAIFLYYIFSISKKSSDTSESKNETHQYSNTQSSLMILAGMGGLVLGGKWIVDGAVSFATQLGVSEALIGLTIVAVGTSLPELATSAVAAYRKNADIAIGNVVGSNIFNIFWILGVSATVAPLPFSEQLGFDLIVMISVTLLLFFALFVGKKHKLKRWQGVMFVCLYILYTIILITRG